jgi:hypothetical protein
MSRFDTKRQDSRRPGALKAARPKSGDFAVK